MLCYIALGSNIEPDRHLDKALSALTALGTVQKTSSRYRTEPLGDKTQPWYSNQVVGLETDLAPEELLKELKALEQKLGRQPRGHWQAREIDLDILLYENQTIATLALQIPHPGLAQRRFVLAPLAEIAPETIDPTTGKTIHQLLQACQDQLAVQRYEPTQY